MKTQADSLYQYEGNRPHAITKVFMEGGSLVCEYCGACICDHNPVTDEDLPVYELTWEVKATVSMRRDWRAKAWVGGCHADPTFTLL